MLRSEQLVPRQYMVATCSGQPSGPGEFTTELHAPSRSDTMVIGCCLALLADEVVMAWDKRAASAGARASAAGGAYNKIFG